MRRGARALCGALAAAATCGCSATQIQLQTPVLSATVTVDPSGTCVSALAFSLTLANDAGFTPNLLTNIASCGSPSSATLLESPPGTLLTPTGGTIAASNATYASITGIALGSVAVEDWTLSLTNSSLAWEVRRSYLADGQAASDQMPALWLQTTTVAYEPHRHDSSRVVDVRSDGPTGTAGGSSSWQSQVQLPSYLSLDAQLLDSSVGAGYRTAAGQRIALLGDATTGDHRRVLMSPSGVALHVGIAGCRFAMYRPASVFTQQIGLGAECASGPGNAYAFAAGDVRSNTLVADFRPAAQGHGYFDFSVPASAPPAVSWLASQASIAAAVFTMPMGWVSGNSPQCETCIHEISVFPQLQGMFRLTAPPTEPSAADGMGSSGASCPPFTNPFCGSARTVNTVEVDLECAPGQTISSISAAYGTPTIVPGGAGSSGGCSSFTRNASCDDATFQAYASATCLNTSSCSLVRKLGDPDPCPNVEKTIVAVATCSGGSGSTGPAGGRQVPPPGSCPTLQQANALHLDFLLSNSVNGSGVVAPRWSIVNGNDWSFGGIIDQFPHMLLAVYYHALNTNDTAAVRRWMPTLDSIAGYMLTAMDVNSSYLLTNTNPACDGVANHSCADNFWDDVRFGWHDAIVGVYAVDAFHRLADLKAWLGDTSGAATYYALHTKMVQAYNAEYWSDALGGYRDWVDATGDGRSYFYTWQQFAAIEFGLASPAQAATILGTRDRLYAQIESAYNLTAGSLFCPPTNLIPLDPSDLTVDFDDEYQFGHYENGCIFHWMCGLEMQALGRVRGPQAALDRLNGALSVFNTTRLWGQRWGWLEGTPLGSDVLNDSLFLLYGGLQGALNIRATLLGGLQVLGPAAPALEGGTLTFGLLGQDVTVTVKDGYAQRV